MQREEVGEIENANILDLNTGVEEDSASVNKSACDNIAQCTTRRRDCVVVEMNERESFSW